MPVLDVRLRQGLLSHDAHADASVPVQSLDLLFRDFVFFSFLFVWSLFLPLSAVAGFAEEIVLHLRQCPSCLDVPPALRAPVSAWCLPAGG